MPYTPAQRQALNEAKSRIAVALTAAGVPSMFCDTMADLRTRARRVFGPPLNGETNTEYFNRVADLKPRAKAATTGQVVVPRVNQPLRIRPWRPTPHLRAAEIDALPTPVSMSGRVKSYVGFEERK
ncbi:hypothetical protein [uncultured Castellaniella sp.]|uniref:hypothetical protein n=1 Tax=uncultured Castellaniella sp. TaxID=647907 RepID=UPI0026341B6B|nr:hypothetical protein [uncultured Castellaniella sp.]